MKLQILWLALCFLPGACQILPDKKAHVSATEEKDSTDLVLRISQQSRLYTAECKVHKIVTHEDILQWEASILGYDLKKKLPVGQRRIAIPIDVTLRVYIDFSSFGPDQVKRQGENIEVLLPDPRIVVSSTRVDHKGIKQYTDFTRQAYTDEEMTQFTRQGVMSILKQVPKMGILETAQTNAGALLIPLLTQLGFEEENIRITFMEQPENLPLESIYDNEGSVIQLTKE